MVEIEPKGTYFEVDSDGYLINPTSLEKIQEKWKPILGDLIEKYKLVYGDKLKNIMVRGSVAKGQAVENISDFDSHAYVDSPENEIDETWIGEFRRKLKEKYPFVDKFDIGAEPASLILDPKERIWLIQSLCIYGEKMEPPKIKPGKEMYIHFPLTEKRFGIFKEKIAAINTPQDLKACMWITKNILRVGFEMTMERSKRFTRDLYLCYKDFSEYYPEKEPEMKEVLFYAINPTADKENLLQMIDSIVPWMIEECKRLKSA